MSRMCARGLHLDLGLHVAARHGAERVRGQCALLRRRSWMARCEYSSALGWLALNAAGADGLTSSPSAAFAAVPSAHATISQSTCITRSAGLVRDGELPWCVPQAERPISYGKQAMLDDTDERERMSRQTAGHWTSRSVHSMSAMYRSPFAGWMYACTAHPRTEHNPSFAQTVPQARGSPGKPRPRPSVAHLCATATFMVALL